MNSTSKYKKDQISWWEKCWQQILILKSQYLCNPILQRYGIRKFKFEVKTQFIYEWFSFEVLLGYLRQFFYVYLFYLYLHTQHTPNPEAHVRDELPPKFVKINKFNQMNWALNSNFQMILQRKWVFATNSNLPITISYQSDGEYLWYFKFTSFDLTEFIDWNI